jgi:hypothetical protein
MPSTIGRRVPGAEFSDHAEGHSQEFPSEAQGEVSTRLLCAFVALTYALDGDHLAISLHFEKIRSFGL